MTDISNLISVQKAAEMAGCSASYLRKLASQDRIEIHKVSKKYYLVDRRSVEKFFAEPRKLGRPRSRT